MTPPRKTWTRAVAGRAAPRESASRRAIALTRAAIRRWLRVRIRDLATSVTRSRPEGCVAAHPAPVFQAQWPAPGAVCYAPGAAGRAAEGTGGRGHHDDRGTAAPGAGGAREARLGGDGRRGAAPHRSAAHRCDGHPGGCLDADHERAHRDERGAQIHGADAPRRGTRRAEARGRSRYGRPAALRGGAVRRPAGASRPTPGRLAASAPAGGALLALVSFGA